MYESFLRTVPLLAGLSPTEVSKIADSLEPVEYGDGDTIVEQGEQGDNFFFMVEGEALVSKVEENGADAVDLTTLKEGDYFGELALITDKPRAATVVAKGPVKCVCLNTQAFIRLLGPCMDLLKRHSAAYEKYEPLLN